MPISSLLSSSPESTSLSSQLLWSQIKNPCSQWAVNISLTSPSTHSQAARMFVWVCTAQTGTAHLTHSNNPWGRHSTSSPSYEARERVKTHTPLVCQSDSCLSCLCPDIIFFWLSHVNVTRSLQEGEIKSNHISQMQILWDIEFWGFFQIEFCIINIVTGLVLTLN